MKLLERQFIEKAGAVRHLHQSNILREELPAPTGMFSYDTVVFGCTGGAFTILSPKRETARGTWVPLAALGRTTANAINSFSPNTRAFWQGLGPSVKTNLLDSET